MKNKSIVNVGRRRFIKRASSFAILFPVSCALTGACGAQVNERVQSASRIVGGGCEGCDGMYVGMPQRLNWETSLAPASEPGERLEMSGVVYLRDGVTPAPGMILYFYQTDAEGFYSPSPSATGAARRHGGLRGWLKTNERGEYRFRTIKPAPYPNGDVPAHIHPVVKEPDKNEYYIDDYEFDDDPLLTETVRSSRPKRGGSGIIRLRKDGAGVWTGSRDIVLGLNIPDYY